MHVVELFAGVGGFRIGLERAGGYEVNWFNQWEPSTKAQHGFDCYVKNFHPDDLIDPNSNRDIGAVPADAVPDHDLLVGGFPCQDYSVAATLDKSKGLQGKKGVLWWEIDRILTEKRPPYVILENVDRLLRSPVKQRGRDMGVLLWCLDHLGYAVEWRVLNAADYGFPQKRRRVFIVAAHRDTNLGRWMSTHATRPTYLTKDGFFAGEFPVKHEQVAVQEAVEPDVVLPSKLLDVSDGFEHHFLNAGVVAEGRVWTKKLQPDGKEPIAILGSILKPCNDEAYFIDHERIGAPDVRGTWKYCRAAKREVRTAKNGHEYFYTEGGMAFPDPSDQPARTILTGEGGHTPSRSKHVVEDPGDGRLRLLTPEECEALNGFPPGHTKMIPERWRYFTMGNALVVGLVERIGQRLQDLLKSTCTTTVETASPQAEATTS